jgi:hypothetical protein
MISLRLILSIFVLTFIPYMVGAQASVESLPNLETSTTFLKPSFLSKIYSYFVFISLGAIVVASGVWYRVYTLKHQHPYQFLEATEKSATQLMEDGKIDEAIHILTQAHETIQNDPLKFPSKCQSKNVAIWMLERKIEEFKDLLVDS